MVSLNQSFADIYHQDWHGRLELPPQVDGFVRMVEHWDLQSQKLDYVLKTHLALERTVRIY